MASSRETIADAAFRLFSTAGYDATSVEDIAAAAGVSRSTFFRWYGSKEAVIFPDHESLLAAASKRLASSSSESAIAAVSDALRLVLFHYVAEGERARARYQLTSTVPALRERELASTARYQQLFRRFISAGGDRSETAELRAELMAATIVAAHNRVLRRWLRRECPDPQVEIDAALATIRHLFENHSEAASAAILIVQEGQSWQRVESAIRTALRDHLQPDDPAGTTLGRRGAKHPERPNAAKT